MQNVCFFFMKIQNGEGFVVLKTVINITVYFLRIILEFSRY